MQRPFLKWAGGKYKLLPHILPHLPSGKRLFEPFLGAAAIFLNTHYEHYHLGDSNPDLINLYQMVKLLGEDYIKSASKYFKPKYNDRYQYYRLRDKFNKAKDDLERANLFLYLNRHGYNGLCRYNSQGGFNVPFGSYKNVMFPDEAIYYFHQKSQKAKFYCTDFSKLMQKANKSGDVIYADPPYYPLSKSAKFTQYTRRGFSHEEQQHLANLAERLVKKQVQVVISNHATEETLTMYKQATIYQFPVRRFISCVADTRSKVEELIAVYKPVL